MIERVILRAQRAVDKQRIRSAPQVDLQVDKQPVVAGIVLPVGHAAGHAPPDAAVGGVEVVFVNRHAQKRRAGFIQQRGNFTVNVFVAADFRLERHRAVHRGEAVNRRAVSARAGNQRAAVALEGEGRALERAENGLHRFRQRGHRFVGGVNFRVVAQGETFERKRRLHGRENDAFRRALRAEGNARLPHAVIDPHVRDRQIEVKNQAETERAAVLRDGGERQREKRRSVRCAEGDGTVVTLRGGERRFQHDAAGFRLERHGEPAGNPYARAGERRAGFGFIAFERVRREEKFLRPGAIGSMRAGGQGTGRPRCGGQFARRFGRFAADHRKIVMPAAFQSGDDDELVLPAFALINGPYAQIGDEQTVRAGKIAQPVGLRAVRIEREAENRLAFRAEADLLLIVEALRFGVEHADIIRSFIRGGQAENARGGVGIKRRADAQIFIRGVPAARIPRGDEAADCGRFGQKTDRIHRMKRFLPLHLFFVRFAMLYANTARILALCVDNGKDTHQYSTSLSRKREECEKVT